MPESTPGVREKSVPVRGISVRVAEMSRSAQKRLWVTPDTDKIGKIGTKLLILLALAHISTPTLEISMISSVFHFVLGGLTCI